MTLICKIVRKKMHTTLALLFSRYSTAGIKQERWKYERKKRKENTKSHS